MAVVDEQRASTIDAVFRDTKEEVLGVKVLVDEMHTTFLMRHAFAFASLDKARKLVIRLEIVYKR